MTGVLVQVDRYAQGSRTETSICLASAAPLVRSKAACFALVVQIVRWYTIVQPLP